MNRSRLLIAGAIAGFVLAPLLVVAQLALSGPTLDLYDADSSHRIRVQPPTSVTANRTVTLEDDSTPFDTGVTFGTEAAIEAAVDLPDLQGVLTPAKGGTGQDSSASSGVPEVNAGTWSFGASIGDLASSTSAALATVLSDETGTGAVCLANSPTLVTPSITGLTANRCVRTNASGIVEVAAGDCGSSSADIEAVFQCASGDCSTIAAAAGDSLDMTGGDSSAPCKSGTSAPGTCTVGQCFFDTDATPAGEQLYFCTATDTWSKVGDGAGGGSAIVVDLGDDGGDDTTDLAEIAVVNDSGGAFSVVSDKLTIDVANLPSGGGGSASFSHTWDVADCWGPGSTAAATHFFRGSNPILVFPDGSDTEIYCRTRLTGYNGSSGITVCADWAAGTTTNTGAVNWGFSIESHTLDVDSIATDSFATELFESAAPASVGGEPVRTCKAFSHGAAMDDLADGETFRVRLRRDGNGSDGTDSMTAEAQPTFIHAYQTP